MGPFALFGDIPESMECQSPLAQVDRKFHDLVTGRWLSVVSTSEPGDEPAIFFHCTIQQPRIAVQYSVIVEGNLMLCHQHHPHYDHFAVNLDPTHQATMEEPHGRTRPCHHTNSIAGRTVDMSICPATTCTQAWGGRPTYHRMNSITGRSIVENGSSHFDGMSVVWIKDPKLLVRPHF